MRKILEPLTVVALLAFAIVALTLACCSASQKEHEKQALGDAWDCSKEIARAAVSGDPIGAVLAVRDQIEQAAKQPDTILGVVEKLIATYGPAVVACTAEKLREQHMPPAHAAADPIFIATSKLVEERHWKFAGGGS